MYFASGLVFCGFILFFFHRFTPISTHVFGHIKVVDQQNRGFPG
jgi:hypothetical protein